MRLQQVLRSNWKIKLCLAGIAVLPISAIQPGNQPAPPSAELATKPVSGDPEQLECSFTDKQIELIEKLNRSDRGNLIRLKRIVVPDRWDLDELAYSPLPITYKPAQRFSKAMVVYKPGQVFGAYQRGKLVRWGPVSTGAQSSPTPGGLFHLNWKATLKRSTVNRGWLLPWYFNFQNKRGHSFHTYELPGRPASHGCIRLLDRDASWIYNWGEQWELGPRGWEIRAQGTPVLIVGEYNHDNPAMWRTAGYLEAGGQIPLIEQEISVTFAELLPDEKKEEKAPSVADD
jgi:hypothetical protein